MKEEKKNKTKRKGVKRKREKLRKKSIQEEEHSQTINILHFVFEYNTKKDYSRAINDLQIILEHTSTIRQ